MAADFTGKTDDQLVELNQTLGRQVDDLQAQRVAINDELRRRASAAEIEALQQRIADLQAGRSAAVAPGAVVDSNPGVI